MFNSNGISDASQHIGNRVGHHNGIYPLPACLFNTGDQTLLRKVAETNTTDAKLAINGTGPAAEFASVFAPGRELGNSLGLSNLRFTCHVALPS